MSLDIKNIPPCLINKGTLKKNYKILLSKLSILHSKKKKKEMPIYASFVKGSYTIEATIIIPLLITLMVFGLFSFRVLQVQSGMQKSIDYACRTMAVTLGNKANDGQSDKDGASEDTTLTGELSEAKLLAETIALAAVKVAQNDVPLNYIDGGAAGVNFLESSAKGNYIDLRVSYKMTFPVGLLGHFSFDVSQRSRNRKWVGYDKNENATDGEYVYITEHGQVYHKNYYCTYLNPSVHRVPIAEIKSKRNKGGAIYYQCERCKNIKPTGFLYITDYGTSFHNSVNCTEIKHSIKKVLYDEVKDTMRPCSKCSAGKEH